MKSAFKRPVLCMKNLQRCHMSSWADCIFNDKSSIIRVLLGACGL